MENIDKRIKQINIENFIWIIYFFIIGLCLYANSYEKKYFCTNDLLAKEKYRKITITIFIIAVIIYSYFFIDSYEGLKDIDGTNNKRKKYLNELNLLSTSLILISGFIFLYISIVDVNLDTEIAFG